MLEYFPNLVLEDVSRAHIDRLWTFLEEDRDNFRKWLSWFGYIKTQKDLGKLIDLYVEKSLTSGAYTKTIVFKGEIVGLIGLNQVDWTNERASIGYWLGKAYRGRGIAANSTRLVMNDVFCRLKLHKVQIFCATENLQSQKIPQRLGFQCDGTLALGERFSTGFVDLLIYSLLDREYKRLENSAA